MSVVSPEDSRRSQEPWLIWDNRANVPSGTHALICGVSNYLNLPDGAEAGSEQGLGMRRLSSTALTAYLMVDWLLTAAQANQLDPPLATCRVLLSPTQAELDKAPLLAAAGGTKMSELKVPRCSLSNLEPASHLWRTDARCSTAGATLFYFAGHGIQRSRGDQVILLDEFGGTGGLLKHGVEVNSIRNGMAPTLTSPSIARTQLYFIDACRNLPRTLLGYDQLRANWIFDVQAAGVDNRCAPIFFAAPPDGQAQAVVNEHTLFGIALLRCLSGEAAAPPRGDRSGRQQTHWHITSNSLNAGLGPVLKDLNEHYQGDQGWTVDGFGEDVVLRYLSAAPTVPISIVVEPGDAVAQTNISINNPLQSPALVAQLPNGQPYPYRQNLPAGYYEFLATGNPPFGQLRELCLVEPLGSRVCRLRFPQV